MKCALKTDAVNESLCSPEFWITTFFYCSENECMQIICKGAHSCQIMAKQGEGAWVSEAEIIAKPLWNDLGLFAMAQNLLSQGKRIFKSLFFGHI